MDALGLQTTVNHYFIMGITNFAYHLAYQPNESLPLYYILLQLAIIIANPC